VLRIEVIRAWPRRFESCRLELPPGATVADALRGTGWTDDPAIRAVAVHGLRVAPTDALQDGDRVELLRALVADPKDARRRRAAGRAR
jgi:putative ubiquitin-RnfH superfamily antitoxin RatB of RatAB toxin-antitoxin module